jgi:hypothetical protein
VRDENRGERFGVNVDGGEAFESFRAETSIDKDAGASVATRRGYVAGWARTDL